MSLQQYNDIFSEPFNKQLLISVEGTNVVLTNEDICEESMSLEDSICSEENLRFGACEAKCFKIRVVNDDIVFKDKWLTVALLCDLPDVLVDSDGNHIVNDDGDEIALATNESTSISLGRFKVFSDEPSNDRSWRDLTCYDEMNVILNTDVASWYSALTFPMTIKNLRDSFFTYLGITQETVTLANDTFSTQGGFVAEGELSGKVIIEAICELNGVFGHMKANGKFGYIDITATESVTLSYYEDGTGKYSDYVTDAITGVLARGSEDDVGTSVGTTTNVYVIENNPLVFGSEGTQALTTALTNLLNKISTVSFRPFAVSTYGNPMLTAGSGITIVTRDITINSIVISKTMNGIQALRDNLEATSDKSQPSMVNNVQSQISRTKGKVHDLRVDVNELTSEIYEIDPQTGTKTSKIEQLADKIVLQVNTNGDIVMVELGSDPSTGDSIFNLQADVITLAANKKIEFTTGTFEINASNLEIDDTGSITIKGSASTYGTFKISNHEEIIGSWGGNAVYSFIEFHKTYPTRQDAEYSKNGADFLCRTIYADGSGDVTGGFEEYMKFSAQMLTLQLMTDVFAASETDRTKKLSIMGLPYDGYIDIYNEAEWLPGYPSLLNTLRLMNNIVKVKTFDIYNSSMSGNYQALSSYVSLDNGYKFLGWLQPASSGWVTTFPIYINDPSSSGASVFWGGTLPSGTNYAIHFAYLEIRDLI